MKFSACKHKNEVKKLVHSIENSRKKRINALTKMYDGLYNEALPLLIEHINLMDKILLEPNSESIKAQQSIIQCFNSNSLTTII